MKRLSYIFVLLLLVLTGCYYPGHTERHYTTNFNFVVTGDSIALQDQKPMHMDQTALVMDTDYVTRGDQLVVAQIAVIPEDSIDSVWVKVARDQETMGWVHESELLSKVAPDDPISSFINLFSKRHLGYFVGLIGVALVVFNGEFILKLNPLGDLLTLGASVMWVIYSVVIAKVEGKYDSLMITRKIFFYGVITLLPYFAIEPFGVTWEMISRPIVIGNLLFLGLLASLICYWTWNVAIIKLGAVRSTNYLYINPIVAMITSYLVLNEHITPLAIIGTMLILTGMYLAQKTKQ